MRRLLLLLLVFLLPLQLLAAPVGELSPMSAAPTSQAGSLMLRGAATAADVVAVLADLTGLDLGCGHESCKSESTPAPAPAPEPEHETDPQDRPAKQLESEDHAMPAQTATPQLGWQSFPHAFTAPPGGASFVRDQLHPPPLA